MKKIIITAGVKKKILKYLLIAVAAIVIIAGITVFTLFETGVILVQSPFEKSSIKRIDLSVPTPDIPQDLKYLFDLQTVDIRDGYMAHPDSVLLKNGNILQMYPAGHGKGAVLNKISTDGGLTYDQKIENTPKSWEKSLETPTVYRLEFKKEGVSDKLIMISACPLWGKEESSGGFNCSVSNDEGNTWSEFELFYPLTEGGTYPIVAMASLTRLKENGEFVDEWMGFFHDRYFNNYKSILTFDDNGKANWSKPEKYFSRWLRMEKGSRMCEVEVIRSDKGLGDELCLITRSQTKLCNSLISFSKDEGKTWSRPKELPSSLNGERFKAEYTTDGRLLIAFRSIERDKEGRDKYVNGGTFYSEGPAMWVGTYDDLKNGADGQYRIKFAHTYLDGQTEPEINANGDTGYCGNTVLPDGTFVISTYGKFSPNEKYVNEKGETVLKTYITSKRINLKDIDTLANLS
ncbi:MAG: sialidase family protein [Oscillospiraceae bacterium]